MLSWCQKPALPGATCGLLVSSPFCITIACFNIKPVMSQRMTASLEALSFTFPLFFPTILESSCFLLRPPLLREWGHPCLHWGSCHCAQVFFSKTESLSAADVDCILSPPTCFSFPDSLLLACSERSGGERAAFAAPPPTSCRLEPPNRPGFW